MKRAKIPGENAEETGGDVGGKREGVTELNNIAGTTANDVGADREAVVRAQAVAEAARKGQKPDLAPAAAIGAPAEPTSIKRKAEINGVIVDVEVPIVRRNDAVAKFGAESKLPRGTTVNKNGTACEGADVPFGVIGDILTPQGRLVNRVIPLDAVKEQPKEAA